MTTLEELNALDDTSLVRGYRAGLKNAGDYSEQDDGYWHGFLNGLVDSGQATISPDQEKLARAYVERAKKSPPVA